MRASALYSRRILKRRSFFSATPPPRCIRVRSRMYTYTTTCRLQLYIRSKKNSFASRYIYCCCCCCCGGEDERDGRLFFSGVERDMTDSRERAQIFGFCCGAWHRILAFFGYDARARGKLYSLGVVRLNSLYVFQRFYLCSLRMMDKWREIKLFGYIIICGKNVLLNII